MLQIAPGHAAQFAHTAAAFISCNTATLGLIVCSGHGGLGDGGEWSSTGRDNGPSLCAHACNTNDLCAAHEKQESTHGGVEG